MVTSGTIVVIEADPALTRRRNGPEPQLYAGRFLVRVLNRGRSGRLIGLILNDVDLASAPLWFSMEQRSASPAPPEARLASASAAGIRPVSREQLRRVTRPAAAVADVPSLLRGELADLVLRFVPAERDLADGWRQPEGQAARRDRAEER